MLPGGVQRSRTGRRERILDPVVMTLQQTVVRSGKQTARATNKQIVRVPPLQTSKRQTDTVNVFVCVCV